MDIATILGLLTGTLLVGSSILYGGSALMFVNIPGLMIVLGGTLAASFMKFSMKDIINSFKVVMKAFIYKVESPLNTISEMVNYTRIAKKEGLIALEKENPSNGYLAGALRYLSDGYDEGLIEEMLRKDINNTVQRHSLGQNLFRAMGGAAPAFGLIGTLIGLVQMLANMGNPRDIGPAMAVALLTTLYGAVLANLVCLPIADKLSFRSQQEQLNKRIILEAAVGISRGISPSVMEESLKVYLSPKDREKAEAEQSAGGE